MAEVFQNIGVGPHAHQHEFRARCHILVRELSSKGRRFFVQQVVERLALVEYHVLALPSDARQRCSLAFVRHPEERKFVEASTRPSFQDEVRDRARDGAADKIGFVEMSLLMQGSEPVLPFMGYSGVPWEHYMEDVVPPSETQLASFTDGDPSVLNRLVGSLTNRRYRPIAYPLVCPGTDDVIGVNPYYLGERSSCVGGRVG